MNVYLAASYWYYRLTVISARAAANCGKDSAEKSRFLVIGYIMLLMCATLMVSFYEQIKKKSCDFFFVGVYWGGAKRV